MKKKLLKMFMLVLCVCSAYCISACNVETDGGDNNDDFMTAEEIAAKFTNGQFTMKLSVDNEDELYYRVVQTADGYYYGAEKTALGAKNTGNLIYKEGDVYKYYTIQDGKKTFVMNYQNDSTASNYVGTLFSTYFTAYAGLAGEDFAKNGTSTVAGRTCNKYTYSYAAFGNAVSYEYNIDQETGMCLKYHITASSGGETGSYSFEMIEFSLNDATLTAYTSLPLDGDEDGPSTGDVTTFPSTVIAKLNTDFMSETTVPAIVGASKFSYLSVENTATIYADGITQAEYNTYLSTLESNNYTIADEYTGKYATKLLAKGNVVKIYIGYSSTDEQLTLSITATSAVEANLVLPANFKLVWNTINGVTFSVTKIGNDYYKEYTDGGIIYRSFAKYNSNKNNWTFYQTTDNEGWETLDTHSTISTLLGEFLDVVYIDAELDSETYTFAGTEKIANIDCNKFTYYNSDYNETVTYWKSYNNFVLKKATVSGEGEETITWTTTLFDTTVTAFQGVTIPS